MRRIVPYTLALPILLATACGSTDGAALDSPTVDESVTDAGTAVESPPAETAPEEDTEEGTEDAPDAAGAGHEYAFGEGAAFPHPVGAYEHEYQDGVEEDVVYTVDDVTLDSPGLVAFTLTVEVPDLGRIFGTGHLDVQCAYEEASGPASAEEPLGELEEGTHTADMVCEAPESPDAVLVSVANGEDQADFRGPVE